MSVDSLVLLIYVLFPIWKPDSLNCSRGSKHADTAEEAFKSNLQQKAAAWKKTDQELVKLKKKGLSRWQLAVFWRWGLNLRAYLSIPPTTCYEPVSNNFVRARVRCCGLSGKGRQLNLSTSEYSKRISRRTRNFLRSSRFSCSMTCFLKSTYVSIVYCMIFKRRASCGHGYERHACLDATDGQRWRKGYISPRMTRWDVKYTKKKNNEEEWCYSYWAAQFGQPVQMRSQMSTQMRPTNCGIWSKKRNEDQTRLHSRNHKAPRLRRFFRLCSWGHPLNSQGQQYPR